jgi:hypothetical protein
MAFGRVFGFWLFLSIFSISSFAGDTVVLSLIGRDECQAKLVASSLTDKSGVHFQVQRWKIQRTMKYLDTQLETDQSSNWGSYIAALRNHILIPVMGNRVFNPLNTERTLELAQQNEFPFSAISFSQADSLPVEAVLIRLQGHQVAPSDIPGFENDNRTEWTGVGVFEYGGWKSLSGNGSFKIALGPRACAAYENHLGGATQEIPGTTLPQFCAWLKSQPQLAEAAKAIALETKVAPAYFEGRGGSLVFVSPSVEGTLTLRSEGK